MKKQSPPVQQLAPELHRRQFLRCASVLSMFWGSARFLNAAPAGIFPGLAGSTGPALIPRSTNPPNFEFPFSSLNSFATPNDCFYIRSHFPYARLDATSYRLKVEGAVERPLELTLDEVRSLPARSLPMTLECAGNGRAFLVPKAKGVQWEQGAVSNAVWTGVPLSAVLERAGLRDTAVEVVLEGADQGEIATDPKPPGAIHFARSLPIAKARQPEVLLAYRMNGVDLPVPHGFPLRAVVGGWYGMASIKWLTRIVVTDRPFQGYFQSIDYSIFGRYQGLPTVEPLREMQVKALIARPTPGQRLAADTTTTIAGAAWTGNSEVAQVEISTNGGATWSTSQLLDKAQPYSWRLWEHSWRTPRQAGRYALLARATDQRGQAQPSKRDPDRRNYMVNHILPIVVDVGNR